MKKRFWAILLCFFITFTYVLGDINVWALDTNLITSEVSFKKDQWKKLDSTVESNLEVKGFSFKLDSSIEGSISYRIEDTNGAWSNWALDGERMSSESIKNIQITLSDNLKDDYQLKYRAFVSELGWQEWVNAGESILALDNQEKILNLDISLEKISNADDKTDETVANDKTTQEEVKETDKKPEEEVTIPENFSMERSVTPSINGREHIQYVGWRAVTTGNSLSLGTTGQSLAMEAVELSLNNANGGIRYEAHVANIGWMASMQDGVEAGTAGQSLGMQAIKISLTGEMANTYDIYYRAHVENVGWLAWTKNGEIAGSTGESLDLEALDIQLVKKGDAAPSTAGTAYYFNVDYSLTGHVQNLGWQYHDTNEAIVGTSGQSLRLEALTLAIDDPTASGNVVYQSHVQNIGWQGSVQNGQLSGTTGESLRLEAVNVYLTGQLAQKYDIYYRGHVEDMGWLAWTKNGGNAGTEGYSARLEAVQFKIVPKGSLNIPTDDSQSFIKKSTPTPPTDVPSNPDHGQNPGIYWGVDVSYYQSTLDLGNIKNEIDYAILRLGYTGQSTKTFNKDTRFETFYNQAKMNNIPIGGYYYSVATTVDEAVREANYVLSLVKGKSFEYPIYFDFEDAQQANLPASQKEAICNAFCLTLKNNGYVPGVYSRANFLFDYVSASFKSNWDLWVSHYGTNNGLPNGDYYQYKGRYEMWQYTSKGQIPGYSGNLDVNICYYDYPSDIKNSHYNGY